ncbi:MAG: leucine-rich repeat domain-containing protein [Bacteroidia bacterium]|nr:leucine-rich repeat domain-containing protein [Bacteroidia bacterium]
MSKTILQKSIPSLKTIIILLTLNLCAFTNVLAQTEFDVKKLQNPKKYGPEVKSHFKEILVPEYQLARGKKAIFLKNGLRSSQFIAPQLWRNIKDTVYPYRVDIVYSRYPVRDGEYKEIYPLLCNRLIRLFDLDPSLNDTAIKWRTILQTHVVNDEQVNSLFHGVVIWYRTAAEEAENSGETDSLGTENKLVQTERGSQSSSVELIKTINGLRENALLNDSIRNLIDGKSLDVQKYIIQQYLAKALTIKNNIPLTERTPLEMLQYKKQINEYLKHNPFSDSVVWKVFDRHPEWTDALVINDWTGSMYGYGAQVLHWHLNNYKHSGVRFLSLFNDGDGKTTAQKVIGETGGIYSAEASDIPTILNLFNLVRLNGGGGDRPENNIEAILTSIERFPEHKEIILIADNFACIRDIELAYKITKPIRIIVCGYSKDFGVNTHLAYLAKISNGGLYTLENDIENLRIELLEKGEIAHNKDNRFYISPMNCSPKPIFELNYGKESFKNYTDLDSAIAEINQVRKLTLTSKEYPKIPNKVLKMKNLLYLDLSENKMDKIPNSIKNLKDLKELNLSKNQLQKLPSGIYKLKYLEKVDLSFNEIKEVNKLLEQGFYIKQIDVSFNEIENIAQINQLKNLVQAKFNNNKITEIPQEINQLKKVKVLDLSNNQLLYLPRTIIGLIKLEELNLENNQIGSMPPNLKRLRKLKTLNLGGNPLGDKEKERIRRELPEVEISF